MRFMIIRKADPATEAGEMPSKEVLDAMIRYNEEMLQAGVMLQGVGLQPSSKGSRVKFSNGKPIVMDGPFAETKELIAGFSMIQVKSKKEALDWVKRWPAVDTGAELELRPVIEPEDFGEESSAEIRSQEERLRGAREKDQ
jgi:hypothetical protein